MSIAVDRDRAFLESITSIAEEVAAAYAEDVDRDARFPQQTLDALREQRVLSAFVPEELGGGGVSLRRKRNGLRDAPDPGRHDRASSRGWGLV